jgi:hypothetical protein
VGGSNTNSMGSYDRAIALLIARQDESPFFTNAASRRTGPSGNKLDRAHGKWLAIEQHGSGNWHARWFAVAAAGDKQQ